MQRIHIVRSARIRNRDSRRREQTWLDWHWRSWPKTRDRVTKAWGATPSKVIVACVAAGVGRLMARPTSSRLGRVTRGRFAGRSAAHAFAGRTPWRSLAGACWWDMIGAVKRRHFADMIIASHAGMRR